MQSHPPTLSGSCNFDISGLVSGSDDSTGHPMLNMDKDVNGEPHEVLKTAPPPTVFSVVKSIAIVVFIVVSLVGATQFTQRTYENSHNGPWFVTWFCTSFMSLVYLVFFISRLFKRLQWRFREYYRESSAMFGPQGVCLHSVVKYVLPFSLLWIAYQYLYVKALGQIKATDVVIVASSNNIFVYLLSFCLLKDKFSVLRLFAVILSLSGIVMIAYIDNFKLSNTIGIILAALSALCSALFLVLFKFFLGYASKKQVALFMTLIGLVNTLVLWVPIPILHFTSLEPVDFDHMQWVYLLPSALLFLWYHFLLYLGVAYTSPLVISLSVMLACPVNTIVDSLFDKKVLGTLRIIATLMVVSGFAITMIPLCITAWCRRVSSR